MNFEPKELFEIQVYNNMMHTCNTIIDDVYVFNNQIIPIKFASEENPDPLGDIFFFTRR